MEEELKTKEEAARYLKVHLNTLDNYRRRNWITAIRLPNGQVRFDPKELKQVKDMLSGKVQLVQASKDPFDYKKVKLSWDMPQKHPVLFHEQTWAAISEQKPTDRR